MPLSWTWYMSYTANDISLTDLNFNTKNKCVKKCPKEMSAKHCLETVQKW
jgi:hypothetical protein